MFRKRTCDGPVTRGRPELARTQAAGTLIAAGDEAMALSIAVGEDEIPRITRLVASIDDFRAARPMDTASVSRATGAPAAAARGDAAVPADAAARAGLPLVDLLTPAAGRRWSGTRY